MREALLRLRISLLLLAALAAGCAFSEPTLSEEVRCQRSGGIWRATSCDQGGGGGGGY